MYTNNDFYEINTADIWYHERGNFFSEFKDDILAKKLLSKFQEVISSRGKSYYGIKNYDEGDNIYAKKLDRYQKSLISLDAQFEVEYFIVPSGDLFQYNYPVEVKRNDLDYDFWFMMKLRQYDSELRNIEDFLQFQLEKYFQNDFKSFKNILKISFLQYPNLLPKNVKAIAMDWLENDHKFGDSIFSMDLPKSDIETPPKILLNELPEGQALPTEPENRESTDSFKTPPTNEESISAIEEILTDEIQTSILQYLDEFANLMTPGDFSILTAALEIYFKTGSFPLVEKTIRIGRVNKKRLGWNLNLLYREIKVNEKLSVDYLEFAKTKISLFTDATFDKNDITKGNLYAYFTTKTDRPYSLRNSTK